MPRLVIIRVPVHEQPAALAVGADDDAVIGVGIDSGDHRPQFALVILRRLAIDVFGEFIVGDTVSRADVVQEQALDGGQYVGVNVRLHLIYPVFLISS